MKKPNKASTHRSRIVLVPVILALLAGQLLCAEVATNGWFTTIHRENPGAKLDFLHLHVSKSDGLKVWRLGGAPFMDEATLRAMLRKMVSYTDAVMISAEEEVTVARLSKTLEILEEEKFTKIVLFNRVEGIFSGFFAELRRLPRQDRDEAWLQDILNISTQPREPREETKPNKSIESHR